MDWLCFSRCNVMDRLDSMQPWRTCLERLQKDADATLPSHQ
jgi:hypothetical protein